MLKAKGWIDTLAAGETRAYSDFATFELICELTEEGDAHVDEIYVAAFEALALFDGGRGGEAEGGGAAGEPRRPNCSCSTGATSPRSGTRRSACAATSGPTGATTWRSACAGS